MLTANGRPAPGWPSFHVQCVLAPGAQTQVAFPPAASRGGKDLRACPRAPPNAELREGSFAHSLGNVS